MPVGCKIWRISDGARTTDIGTFRTWARRGGRALVLRAHDEQAAENLVRLTCSHAATKAWFDVGAVLRGRKLKAANGIRTRLATQCIVPRC